MLGLFCEANVEVDVYTAPAFAAALRTEIDWAYRRSVFIDCSAITFMDSSAVQALLSAHRYAADLGHLLVIRNLRPNCVRTVRLCDANHELTIGAEWQSTGASPVASVLSAAKP
jgi:anti-anti-sigma factor